MSIPTHPYKLASRAFHRENTVIEVGNFTIGSDDIIMMAGPCSVESRQQILATAHAVKSAGAVILRGGAFKPRTSPYSFQGLEEEGLKLLMEAKEVTGLPVITEVLGIEQLEMVSAYADILQIGARNMQNFSLLNAVGHLRKPVMLKRGMGNTIEELLMSSEYILQHGNSQVMLCERGIRSFERATRNTFDINAIPLLKNLTHLPIIADPSHGVGNALYVAAVARGAVAAGADGLIIEVHSDPGNALSDGEQSLSPSMFTKLMGEIDRISQAMNRGLPSSATLTTRGLLNI